jgi:hypothetical protein
VPDRWVETSRGRTGNEAASRGDRKCPLHDHQEVCLQIPSARGVLQVKEGTSGLKREVRRPKPRCPVPLNYLTYLYEILQPPIGRRQYKLFDKEWSIIRTTRLSCPADPASTTGASSIASSGYCDRVLPGVLYGPRATCPDGRARWRCADDRHVKWSASADMPPASPTAVTQAVGCSREGLTSKLHEVSCLLIAVTMPAGSGHSSTDKARVPTDQALPAHCPSLRQARGQLLGIRPWAFVQLGIRPAGINPALTARL